MKPLQIIVADDDDNYRELLCMVLEEHCHAQVRAFASGEGVLRDLPAGAPHLLLLDYHMPRLSGRDVMRAARARYPRLPVVLISGEASPEDAAACVRDGAVDFLAKPRRLEELVSAMRRVTGEIRAACASSAG
jgi:two-component system response regulator AtoC